MFPVQGHVAVLGAGTIGASWVALCTAHGFDVAVWDPDPAAADPIGSGLPRQMQAVQRLAGADIPLGRGWIADSAEAAVRGAGFVQEAALRIGRPSALYAAIAPVLGAAVPGASGISSAIWARPSSRCGTTCGCPACRLRPAPG